MLFGIDTPFYGPMAASGVMESGTSLAKTAVVGACEPEYAFKMARNFPENGEEITAENAASAVDTLHIAIEVIGRTIGNPDYGQWNWGDNGFRRVMLPLSLGRKLPTGRNRTLLQLWWNPWLMALLCKLAMANPVMGDPINSLVWLAKTLAASGQQIKAGEWVSTGTCTAAVPAQAGTTYAAKFSTFGEVSVVFS